jgi:type I restriction enzyme R subunit
LYFNGTNAEKFRCLSDAAEFLQKTKDLENRFMAHAKRMLQAFKLCNGNRDFTNTELDNIHYYMAVRSLLFKLTKGTAPDISQMNKKVQELIQSAIKSNDVEDLFSESKDFNAKAIDLFDAKYIEKINKIHLPNTKIKVLQQLLTQAIEEFKKVNKIKAMSFSERAQSVVDAYNLRSADASNIKEILDGVADELVCLLKDLAEEKSSFEKLGVSYEEQAFCDILSFVGQKYEFDYPDKNRVVLASAIHKEVEEYTRYSDWANRKNIKDKLSVAIIRLLDKHEFPKAGGKQLPDNYHEVCTSVIKQAKSFQEYYNV